MQSEREENSDSESESEINVKYTTAERQIRPYTASGTIVRYNNKLYVIRNYSYLQYFHEYYLYKLNPSQYEYEFYLDNDKKIFENPSNSTDSSYKTLMYTKVKSEMKILPPDADIEKEFIDCLQVRYNEGTTITATPEEIQAREAYHKTQFQNTILKLFTKIAQSIYESAKKGYIGAEITTSCSENELTNFKKYPVFYSMPNSDGNTRSTYSEYFYYIVASCYPEFKTLDSTFSEQDRLGILLVTQLKAVYTSLDIQYSLTKSLFPILHIVFPISKQTTLA
jgi:hypothetical protein